MHLLGILKNLPKQSKKYLTMCLKNASQKITLTPPKVLDYMKILVYEQ